MSRLRSRRVRSRYGKSRRVRRVRRFRRFSSKATKDIDYGFDKQMIKKIKEELKKPLTPAKRMHLLKSLEHFETNIEWEGHR